MSLIIDTTTANGNNTPAVIGTSNFWDTHREPSSHHESIAHDVDTEQEYVICNGSLVTVNTSLFEDHNSSGHPTQLRAKEGIFGALSYSSSSSPSHVVVPCSAQAPVAAPPAADTGTLANIYGSNRLATTMSSSSDSKPEGRTNQSVKYSTHYSDKDSDNETSFVFEESNGNDVTTDPITHDKQYSYQGPPRIQEENGVTYEGYGGNDAMEAGNHQDLVRNVQGSSFRETGEPTDIPEVSGQSPYHLEESIEEPEVSGRLLPYGPQYAEYRSTASGKPAYSPAPIRVDNDMNEPKRTLPSPGPPPTPQKVQTVPSSLSSPGPTNHSSPSVSVSVKTVTVTVVSDIQTQNTKHVKSGIVLAPAPDDEDSEPEIDTNSIPAPPISFYTVAPPMLTTSASVFTQIENLSRKIVATTRNYDKQYKTPKLKTSVVVVTSTATAAAEKEPTMPAVELGNNTRMDQYHTTYIYTTNQIRAIEPSENSGMVPSPSSSVGDTDRKRNEAYRNIHSLIDQIMAWLQVI